MDVNLKLIRRNAVLSSAFLQNSVAKETYNLPLEPASSGLFGEGLSRLLERSDKLTDEKQQKALYEVVVHSVKTGKDPGQHKTKHTLLLGAVALKRARVSTGRGRNLRRRVASPSSKVIQPPRVAGTRT